MTRFELNQNIEYVENKRIHLANMLTNNETLSNYELLQTLYGEFGVLYAILNDMRIQRENRASK